RFEASGAAVELGQTNFGFLGVRVAKTMSERYGGGRLANADGATGEPAIFGKASRWVDYSGPAAPGRGRGDAYPRPPRHPPPPPGQPCPPAPAPRRRRRLDGGRLQPGGVPPRRPGPPARPALPPPDPRRRRRSGPDPSRLGRVRRHAGLSGRPRPRAGVAHDP